MILIKKALILSLAVGFISLTGCKDKEKVEAEKMEMEEKAATSKADAEEKEAKMKEEARKKDMRATSIAAIAGENPELSTLVSALKAAGLVDMMSSEGSYTVFAPTNNAFEKLPSKMSIGELAKDENKELLSDILKYHVVAGKISSDKLVKAIEGAGGKYTFKTVNSKELTASLKGDQLIIKDEKNNKIQVLKGNVKASNGIVHIVSDVMIPKS
ncbi:fasciclin domain-containing protein [Cellulophaga sp. HaHaR_3_176]|uniref:fasciclin domain-containing protein n=1 Tax=Cellulophaga sp. HaHaR_3_176 TaxID=1942464 RepID=UPI001C1FDD40|nr:fasciclin domain-containing protein [Cellulophaga sp. HaHaR_3_176]QWX85156.1 fasciclin domain-containing protein [Cellulophaga sp. HaHaR_3_176]